MNEVTADYREDSVVARKKKTITDLVNNHWSYMDKVLCAGVDVTRKYNFEEVMEMREWDYTSAMTHGYGHGYEDAENTTDISMVDCIARQKTWALKTFGPGDHSQGLLKHIKKEVIEIMEDPSETEEWIDIIILAMEGAWRSGATPEEIAQLFGLKMSKNERRNWPAVENIDADIPIEHLTWCEKEIVNVML